MTDTSQLQARDRTLKGKVVLVVDDDDAIRMLVTRLFARNGFDVVNASDGEEAMARLSERPFDLVVLDVMMPRVDGISVANHIAASPLPHPHVIVMTAAVPAIIERLPAGQVWKVINKPFNLESLLQEGLAALATDESASATSPAAPAGH